MPLNSSLSLKVQVSLNVSSCLRIIGREQWLHWGVGSPSREHLAVSGDVFDCINWGVGRERLLIGF